MVWHTGATVGFEEFQDYREAKSALSATQLMHDWIALNAAKGQEVDLGPLGRSRLGMKGSFTGSPKRILDKQVTLTLAWIFPRKLKERVANAGAKLVRKRVAPVVKEPLVQQIKAVEANGQLHPAADIYVPGQFIRIYGARLKFNPAAEDEGVFIIKGKQKPRRLTEALRITQQELLVRIPDDVSGQCKLRVVRRHPAKTGELLWGELWR
ncbi:hypothetical protein [Cerasicoccus fimbriatus]|uniref:hypothetical protein n=1 Tax=Cerasicoccus fimbriatus TaxID=3014554 RepID=UPI0022B4EF15|nr:hypothetical protein [Cerasicoccus sp. TK19100]